MDHGSMPQMMGMGGDMMGGGFTGFWVVMVVMMVVIMAVVVGLLVAGAIWLARTLRATDRRPGDPAADARRELDHRYARGDLTREEYLQRRTDLEGGGP
jgi:putative membrane protein